jgi:hypothetical protein
MHDNKIKELSDEIEALEMWVVDHPDADYHTKKEVVDKWAAKNEERLRLIKAPLIN